MDTPLAVRALGMWIAMMAAESIHGVLRAIVLVPLVGDHRSRQLGVFTGSLLIVAIAWLLSRSLRGASTAALAAIGCGWVALTLLFEIGLGRWVFQATWSAILSDYDLGRGGLMPLGLFVMAWSPLLVTGGSARLAHGR